jgi:hypothetical protein
MDSGIWKGNNILIEFPSMVSNRQVRLQMDTYGFKSGGTVAWRILPRKAALL